MIIICCAIKTYLKYFTYAHPLCSLVTLSRTMITLCKSPYFLNSCCKSSSVTFLSITTNKRSHLSSIPLRPDPSDLLKVFNKKLVKFFFNYFNSINYLDATYILTGLVLALFNVLPFISCIAFAASDVLEYCIYAIAK